MRELRVNWTKKSGCEYDGFWGATMIWLSRRRFAGALLLGGAVKSISPLIALAAAADDSPRKIRWRVPVAHVETVEENLQFEGTVTAEKDEKGIPLLFIFVGTVLIPYLADAVLALRREIVYGGVVIDTRGSEIVIDNDKRLDAGVIVVITPDGTDIYERDEFGDPSELVAALLKGK